MSAISAAAAAPAAAAAVNHPEPRLDDFLIYDEVQSTFRAPATVDELRSKTAKTWEAVKAKAAQIPSSSKGEPYELVRESFERDCNYSQGKGGALTKRTITMLTQWIDHQAQAPLERIDAPEGGWTPENLTEGVKQQLVLEAQKARTHSYSPYSHFAVGAVLLTKRGVLIGGTNVENAAYGSTICAERTAIVSATAKINHGISIELLKEIVAVGLVLRSCGSPCGSCRQMLNEFNPKMAVVMGDVDGTMKPAIGLNQLLPDSFGPENLR